ncbi:MAG: 2-amino-4-hydroxy-6-hydroxymethyldihydropteridine diphosphokinase [Candidatus Cloacimonas sp.]|jgi:2-amino-4-hydroxy-6-hydroxymethyldihydropteridine diphosphokinase|nr:2-amino-4-hydroxy-6-hydroxymethyldihydropteridine diphosphokinase [Candidatus Cloacimonas sp.]
MIYYLCLGANLEKPEDQLREAKHVITEIPGVMLLRESSVIKCAAYGKKDQPDFYNQVLEIESNLFPQLQLHILLEIEKAMGRTRREKWGPRLIDIDILLAGNLVIDTRKQGGMPGMPELTLPHPDLHNRAFALQLLAELIPDFIHPTMHKSISELYYTLTNKGGKP